MGQALYRTYRSKSLDEIIGQEHITTTLASSLKSGKLSHAYLLTGPRGTGKTSVARILAHEINGLPYTDDSTHIDIIEIDAASNRRIDEIRDLRDRVSVAPTSAKYKVYIIDEVHMLTKEAFNALLKTLEEPPAHVVFILATTDAHKLPETIISRTQRFSFKPVPQAQVIAHLRSIATAEVITIDDDALALLAEHGEGSFRDSISMLDQARNLHDSLTAEHIRQLLGVPPKEGIEKLVYLLSSGTSAQIMSQLAELYDQGYQPAAIAKQIAAVIRIQLSSDKLTIAPAVALQLLKQLLEVPIAHDSARFLELSLLQAAPAALSVVVTQAAPPAALPDPAPEPLPVKKTPAKLVKTPPVDVVPKPAVAISADEAETWQNILGALKAKHNTLYGLARMAKPDLSVPGTLRLSLAFDFHRKQLSDAQNQKKLLAIISEITGQKYKLECVVDKQQAIDAPAAAADDGLANISNIFGGGELVE